MSEKKPPTQVASAEGIAAVPVTMNEPEPAKSIDWRKLCALPPFQMFVHERTPCPPEGDSERWAFNYVTRFIQEVDESVLLDKYIAWHRAKGCWPNETPFGVVRE